MFPVLYRQGSFTLYTHDVFTTLGLLVGLLWYGYELRRRGMLSLPIICISLAALIGGGIGARLVLAWEHPEYYVANAGVPLTALIEHSGKSIIGAFEGGYLAVVLAKKALRYRRSTGDCFALAIPLGLAVGRIGCFLSELPLGTPTTLPWGIAASPEQVARFPVCPGCAAPMHPSMVYEILFNLAIFAVLLRYRDRIFVQGDTLKVYLLAYAVFRFAAEFVRGNQVDFAGLTGPQLVLLPLAALLVWHFARNWRRGVYQMPLAPLPAAVLTPRPERALATRLAVLRARWRGDA
jgi:phosphatidylglycerol---prolipoprotein diacylglyceryl transferase